MVHGGRSPGDGKTTALLNTGLQFPLAEQMEQTSRILTVPGGGTLHCDWWFTNEAVLIDTAGRYARHDDGGEASAAQRNAGEWQAFSVCCVNIAPARRLTA